MALLVGLYSLIVRQLAWKRRNCEAHILNLCAEVCQLETFGINLILIIFEYFPVQFFVRFVIQGLFHPCWGSITALLGWTSIRVIQNLVTHLISNGNQVGNRLFTSLICHAVGECILEDLVVIQLKSQLCWDYGHLLRRVFWAWEINFRRVNFDLWEVMRIAMDQWFKIFPVNLISVRSNLGSFFWADSLPNLHVCQELFQILSLSCFQGFVIFNLWLLNLNGERCVAKLLYTVYGRQFSGGPLNGQLRNQRFCELSHLD